MPVDLYYLPPSPPCRSVMMLARALGIHLNLKVLNIMEGEHLKPEFDKVIVCGPNVILLLTNTEINPQHTVPTINDNGFILWESRAIMGYFVEKYAINDSYYPKDVQSRGTVDQRLYFDLGTLNNGFLKTYFPVIRGERKTIDDKGLEALEKAFGILDTFLEESDYVAGDHLTIADFSIVVTVSTIDELGFDVARYDNVVAWYQRCKNDLADFGYDEINVAGAKILGDLFRSHVA